MRRFTLALATLLLLLFLAGVGAQEATAHEGSQGTVMWSKWREVTWNIEYREVRHKHYYNRTICQMIQSDGDVERIRLESNNASNKDCTGIRRR